MKLFFVVLASVLVTLVNGEASGNLPSAPKASSPTYTMLAPYNGQYTLKMYVRQSPYVDWVLHTCNATAFGAPCNQPVLYGGSEQEVMISFTLKNQTSFRTWKNGTPEEVVVRLDYAPVSQVDRGWRKKNQAYPGHGWHAKWTFATIPFSLEGGQAVWKLSKADEVTDAVLYPEVCTLCVFADGSKDYCHCDRRANVTAGTINTVESAVVNSITPAMRGAAIALSIFSPVLLFVYSMSDTIYYRRTGKSLRLAHA